MRKTSVIIALMLCMSTLIAKEYHVSSIKGYDKNNGEKESPFKSISKAAEFAMPGDIITVHAGTYREWVNPPRGGISDNERITYRTAAGEKVELKGSEIITGWENIGNGVWKVEIPNTFFGSYNPYKDPVYGDWFDGMGRIHHTGDVYINGKSLYETVSLDKVKNPIPKDNATDTEGERYVWYSESDDIKTTIYANFQQYNPSKELIEISVRPTCFYPLQQGLNYITISGFDISQAATQWGAPTANQIGMVSTHWNKGWIIENNTIHDTKCNGITLGKEYSTGHNVWLSDQSKDGSLHYIEVTFRTIENGWNKENIGSHIVRGNTIYNCEQTGMCGSQGAAFSKIYDNHIYNIWVKRQFTGAEIGGIKFHGAIDTDISHNRINNAARGIWLDWMAQGARISRNILYDNILEDVFLEVNHGPCMLDNNIMLSPLCLNLQSQSSAFVNNIISGDVSIRNEFTRYTPYHHPHSTRVMGLSVIPSGDDRYFNNIFIGSSTDNDKPYKFTTYNEAKQKIYAENNVFYKGAKPTKYDINGRLSQSYDPSIVLEEKNGSLYLYINIDDMKHLEGCSVITTNKLGSASLTKLPFEQASGDPYLLDSDYFGVKTISNRIAGPISTLKAGSQKIKIW